MEDVPISEDDSIVQNGRTCQGYRGDRCFLPNNAVSTNSPNHTILGKSEPAKPMAEGEVP
jgi:hypothetical protein